MSSDPSPLTGSYAAEVALPKAPLIRAIAQVRFPAVLSVGESGFVAPFQEALRGDYPVLRAEQSRAITFSEGGPSHVGAQTIWRFHDIEQKWQISLAPDFVAVETGSYESRADFLSRFRKVIQALADHVRPSVLDRVGVRYIDRISDEGLERISKLVRPEMLGVMSSPLAEHASHSLCESVFSTAEPGARLLARWGTLPANATVDRAAIEPLNKPSWILDLDMSCAESATFDVDDTVLVVEAYARRIYSFFRWAVTDAFIREYGGKL